MGLLFWLIVLLAIYGIFIEPHRMKVRNVKISNQKGLKIAHFTDTHFAWHTGFGRFAKFARNIQKNQPDVILFTGDLYDKVSWGKLQNNEKLIEMLSNLTAPKGKFAILGNHDFDEFGHSDFVRQILVRSGFTVLTNESQLTADFAISGLDDMREGNSDFDISPEPSDFALLMVHEPDSVARLSNLTKFDLIIAGHSHGGQIRIGKFRLKNNGSKLYDSGFYQLFGNTKLFVNAGIGLTFLPIRFGVPPEIVYYDI